jgi:peptidoglycan/LPS O-acetylase OafA/YrhL
MAPGKAGDATSAADRYWHIDALRGAAMLCVLLIHADPLRGNALHNQVVNRAVPVLLVLFGLSSQLSWDRLAASSFWQAARSYWSARLVRLVPPVWAAVCAWWLLVATLQIAPNPDWKWLLAHALGYVPQLGTGWFITLILPLVLLFPFLYLALRVMGPAPTCVAALAISGYLHLRADLVTDWVSFLLRDSAHMEGFFRFYYFWIFPPARVFLLVAGMILAQRGVRIPLPLTLACAGFVVASAIVRSTLLADSGLTGFALHAITDVPLTLLALELFRVVFSERSARVLIWLGRSSWGVYLGQMVVHCALYETWLRTFEDTTAMRWLYFACLLLGALLWVWAERGVRAVLARVAARRTALIAAPSAALE